MVFSIYRGDSAKRAKYVKKSRKKNHTFSIGFPKKKIVEILLESVKQYAYGMYPKLFSYTM